MRFHISHILGLFVALTKASFAADARRPNILWLIAEDMSPDAVACYGGIHLFFP